MSEYLTKEEIRKWRSSLERITLEEYAARLGKVIQEEKQDESLVDSVILKSLNSMTQESYIPKVEKIQALAVKSFAKERELQSHTTIVKQEIPEQTQIDKVEPVLEVSVESIENKAVVEPEVVEQQKIIAETVETENEITIESKVEQIEQQETEQQLEQTETSADIVKQEQGNLEQKQEETIGYSFKKALTSREQIVFDHFLENKNLIVYAKDLAKLLALPTDYIYKYIKNLRSKLNENILQNAVNGGYILKV